MKRIIRVLLVIAILCMVVFTLTACEKKDKNEEVKTKTKEETNETSSIIGNWRNSDLGSRYTYTFNDDGTGQYDAAGTIMEFTYSIDGDKISILYSGDTIPFDTEYHINGDILNIVDSIGNDTLYKKVKI